MNGSLENISMTLPIGEEAYQVAQHFSAQQPTPQKAAQVRENTLAIYAVNSYLQLMGIGTQLTQGDSWNPVVRLCADVADLDVTDLGRLECRPLGDEETTCSIPPEVWEDRIGYVVVQLDDSHREAQLVGFSPTAREGAIPLSELHPIEELLTHLHQLQQQSASDAEGLLDGLVDLSLWLRQAVVGGWQTLESLLSQADLAPAWSFRGSSSVEDVADQVATIRKAKILDWEHPLILLMEVLPGVEGNTTIRVQLHPFGVRLTLPPDLRIQVLDEMDRVFLTAQAKTHDNAIRLEFRGRSNEHFKLEVIGGESYFSEAFAI